MPTRLPMLLYFAVASAVYAHIAFVAVSGDPPETFREVVGVAILCGVLAALWPPVLLWRALLGPLPDR